MSISTSCFLFTRTIKLYSFLDFAYDPFNSERNYPALIISMFFKSLLRLRYKLFTYLLNILHVLRDNYSHL
jgi:hypothetical protein